MPPISTIAGSTTSRIMRRRARTKPMSDRVRLPAAPSRCGVNLRTVSVIALLQRGLLAVLLLLDRLAQVLLHGGKMREQTVDVGGGEPGERRLHQVFAELGQALEKRPRAGRQIEPLGAAIVGVGPTLDQAASGEPVEQ